MPCNSDNSCPEEYDTGACCIGSGCLTGTEYFCADFNGIYQGDTSFCEDGNVECIASCAADLNGDGEVKVADLLLLIASWGICP